MLLSAFATQDASRHALGDVLAALGFCPSECPYRIVAARSHWRLREYANSGDGKVVVIVAAPIKKPYIWDLAPPVSVIKLLLKRGFCVYMLEWAAPQAHHSNPGLADYAGRFIGEGLAHVAEITKRAKPVLIGHSLGGTLAAIYAAAHSSDLCGLLLLGAPLSFKKGTSPFRDAVAAMTRDIDLAPDIVPGSLLAQLSAFAAPDAFVWSRINEVAYAMGDARALDMQARIERWVLDEFPVSGHLIEEILRLLYQDDRLCQGTLQIGDVFSDPRGLQLPTLAVINKRDVVAPLPSVAPFLEAMDAKQARLIEYAGEIGVGLQHLAVLIGRQAHLRLWPEILSWLDELP